MTQLQARFALEEQDEQQANSIAAQLRKQGFQVHAVRSRGMTIEGSKDLFEEVFHTQIEEPEEGPRFQSEPVIPDELGGAKSSLYFPTRPTFFR